MPRALLQLDGVRPSLVTTFNTPKRISEINAWWKLCRKAWPELPEHHNKAEYGLDLVTFHYTGGKVIIDRTYKFGSQ